MFHVCGTVRANRLFANSIQQIVDVRWNHVEWVLWPNKRQTKSVGILPKGTETRIRHRDMHVFWKFGRKSKLKEAEFFHYHIDVPLVSRMSQDTPTRSHSIGAQKRRLWERGTHAYLWWWFIWMQGNSLSWWCLRIPWILAETHTTCLLRSFWQKKGLWSD